MASLSDYAETKILGHMLDAVAWTSPPSVWVSLYTDAVGDDDSGTELSGDNYARVQMTGGFTVTGDTATNTAIVTFPTASGDWGTVTNAGIHDAATNGNLLTHAALTASKLVETDDTFEIAIGSLSVTMA
jgi:hypothetical protein